MVVAGSAGGVGVVTDVVVVSKPGPELFGDADELPSLTETLIGPRSALAES